MGIGNLMGGLLSSAAREASDKGAVNLAAKLAEQIDAQSAKVHLLRQALHVTPESPLSASASRRSGSSLTR